MRLKFHCSPAEIRNARKLLNDVLTIITPERLKARICRDPDDDIVLGTALTGNCDCIVTGDRDLLDLKTFQGIDILLPADFWRYEAQKL
jgi:putative PIN family toxin of toxin-antitoxin system